MFCAVPQLTKSGRERLGRVLEFYRRSNSWSMDDLIEQIYEKTGYKISKGTISALERGNNEPKYNTLSILASAGYLPYTVDQLFAIASEQLEADVNC